jgi:AcrR family transcriptional regulator
VDPAAATANRPAAPSAAQARVIAAALDLFAQHGVGVTSLQMIADAVGVTKAAVYHQYKSKDEIVLAAAASELARLEAMLDAAEAEPSSARAREALIAGMVDLAVERRRTASTILEDPVVVRHFAHHEQFRRVMHRLSHLLEGDDPGPEGRVSTAMLIAAISGAAMHPLVADLGDDALRSQLLHVARRLLDLPAR